MRADGDHVLARLGYETKEETDLYDSGAEDFRHEAILRGRTATFVVRFTDLVVVYERHRNGLSEQDFTTGLRILLRAFDGHRNWDVAPVDSKATFDEWAQGVDLVHRFRFRADSSQIIEGNIPGPLSSLFAPKHGTLTIDLRSGDGVDVRDRAIRELVRLAETGCGEVLAVGRKNGHGSLEVQKAWESSKSAERVVREVLLEEDTDEVSDSRLLRILATVPHSPPW
ncbi:hypothetical protein AB0F81_15695 [Actinoplanes sp. NPDC024001]|uniref:hypothetical protein n=1 Tax=Actinoplanes sp. NPDC024001 TaxID=3154598 RepID=UPI0033D61E68